MLETIDEMALDMIHRMMPEDLNEIANNYPSFEPMERVWFKTAVTREIRNEYGLWWEHPLTEKWRTDETGRDIRDGVDYSKDHPDNISSQVYDRIKEMLTEGV